MANASSAPESSDGLGEIDPVSEGTSAVWLKRVQKDPNCQTAWRSLNDRYQTRILVFANSKLGPKLRNRYTAEEVVNEAWIRVFKSVNQFEYRQRGSPYHWLCTQVVRVVLDYARDEERRKNELSLNDASSELSSQGATVQVAAGGPGPASECAVRDLHHCLTQALEKVPDIYREPLILYYLENKTRTEIAAQLGRLPNTVTQLLKRGREIWRDAAGPDLDRIL